MGDICRVYLENRYDSRKECQVASSVKEKMTQELVTAAQRNEELCRTVKENEQEFQV